MAGLNRFFGLFVECPLYGGAYRLVWAVNATYPAARPALSFKQFFARPLDAAVPGFNLFGILHPTDKLVARKRRNIFP